GSLTIAFRGLIAARRHRFDDLLGRPLGRLRRLLLRGRFLRNGRGLGPCRGLFGGGGLLRGGRLGGRFRFVRRRLRGGLHLVRVLALERLMGRDPAVARARQRGVGAALAVREDRRTASRCVLVVETQLGLFLRELSLGPDVDPPTRQARG